MKKLIIMFFVVCLSSAAFADGFMNAQPESLTVRHPVPYEWLKKLQVENSKLRDNLNALGQHNEMLEEYLINLEDDASYFQSRINDLETKVYNLENSTESDKVDQEGDFPFWIFFLIGGALLI